jgi:hypothetical protein
VTASQGSIPVLAADGLRPSIGKFLLIDAEILKVTGVTSRVSSVSVLASGANCNASGTLVLACAPSSSSCGAGFEASYSVSANQVVGVTIVSGGYGRLTSPPSETRAPQVVADTIANSGYGLQTALPPET